LFEHVAILVQHEPRVVEEILRRAAQVDAPAPGGSDGARMQASVERMLDDAHMRYRLAEHGLQRRAKGIGKRYGASNLHVVSV
jgi:hypothetical protein